MHIVITDSGVGGLSVCAYAERFVRTRGFEEPVRLTFANAAPDNDYGYNAMPTRQEKVHTFDRFLTRIVERSAPDFIYVACNTLSVLLPETVFALTASVPIKGIVETGVESLTRELQRRRDATAIIFATQTTIDAGLHARMLEQRGVDTSRVVAQPCPGLADTISEDPDGDRAMAEITRWVKVAAERLRANDPVVACLACTHYGYRRAMFAEALAGAGFDATVVDPNERAVDDIFPAQPLASSAGDVSVELVTKYALPDATVKALARFLADISPPTVAAMQRFVHVPELF